MAAGFCAELDMMEKNKYNVRALDHFNSELAATIASVSKFRKEFNDILEQCDRRFEGSQKQFWSNDRIKNVIKVIKSGKTAMNLGFRRTATQLYWMSKCDVIKKGTEENLIFKKCGSKKKSLCIVPREKYFDILTHIHTSCHHGGRHRMSIKMKNKCFIPKNVIRLFVSMCPGCQARRLVAKKKAKARPNEVIQLNEKGKVNFINFKYCPDGEYKWLLSYQDDGSKYLNLRPLKTVMAAEVTYELIKIFLTFGAPNILQLDMDKYFAAQVQQKIIGIWPNCQVLPKTNSKVNECDKQELEYIIQTWMSRNDTTKWSFGCYVIQYNKNNAISRVLGNTPYKMMFGCEPRVELSATNIARILDNREYKADVQVKMKPETVVVSSQDSDDDESDSKDKMKPEPMDISSQDSDYNIADVKVKIKQELTCPDNTNDEL